MRKIVIILLLPLLLSSCRDKETEDEAHKQNEEQVRVTEERARQIKEEVLELCSRYNAVTDWERKLRKDPLDLEPLYTVQIQDIFLDQKGRPYLFFVDIYDIKKVRDKYLLLANVRRTVGVRRTIYFHLRLTCSPEKIQEILQQGLSAANKYALFTRVYSIEKPDLYLRPAVQSEHLLEENVFAETHPEDVVDFYDVVLAGSAAFSEPNENTFIITGKCEDLIFVGTDDWRYEPSDYERFRKIFDTNQP